MKIDFDSYCKYSFYSILIGLWISAIVASLIGPNLAGNIESNYLVFFIGFLIILIPKMFSQNDLTTICITLISSIIYFIAFFYLMPLIGFTIITSAQTDALMGLLKVDIKISYSITMIIQFIAACLILKLRKNFIQL